MKQQVTDVYNFQLYQLINNTRISVNSPRNIIYLEYVGFSQSHRR